MYHTSFHLQSAFYLAKYVRRSVEMREALYLRKKNENFSQPRNIQDLLKADSNQVYLSQFCLICF